MKQDLTLLIPMYNKAPYIERCVKSLSEQTYLDRTKIIVCDDKSTDNSIEILKQSAEKYNVPMILMMNRENLGLSRTIRNLYRKIETEFWTVLDPDDYYVHPERLSRAVDFLRDNPDHAMHGCNYYWESSEGTRRQLIPDEERNFSVAKFSEMSYFQTSSATFRNFWNDEILNYIDSLAGIHRFHFTQGDSFRNFVAIHYGKLYLDNFIGSSYAMQPLNGIYASLSHFERSLMSIQGNLDRSKFAQFFFHDAESAMFCLENSLKAYFETLDILHVILKNLNGREFRIKAYTMEILNLNSDDISAVIEYLVNAGAFFKSIGVGQVKK